LFTSRRRKLFFSPESMCVYVSVWEREREWGREIVCVFLCLCVWHNESADLEFRQAKKERGEKIISSKSNLWTWKKRFVGGKKACESPNVGNVVVFQSFCVKSWHWTVLCFQIKRDGMFMSKVLMSNGKKAFNVDMIKMTCLSLYH